ncbi:MAG: hypothetical protein JNM10_06750 [Planctomycetia bacterium]|nr:hypothetical protein [Planctomycetia bacterium]
MTVETLALRCTSCGASLSVPSGPAHVTCTFCGTALLVVRSGGVAYLEQDVAEIREGVADLRTGVGELLDGQDDVHRRLARIEHATRERAIVEEMEELEKHGRTMGVVWVSSVAVALAVVAAFVSDRSRPKPELLLLALVGFGLLFNLLLRLPGARRHAWLMDELEALDAATEGDDRGSYA